MKKLVLILAGFALASAVFGQDPKETKLKFQGGVWSGTNGETSIIGVPAAKFTGTFGLTEKAKLEAGIMLIPGIISDKAGRRLGLSAGGAVVLRKDNWKIKPIFGLVFVVKSDVWYALPGIGFIF